jgi:hypothetical protein
MQSERSLQDPAGYEARNLLIAPEDPDRSYHGAPALSRDPNVDLPSIAPGIARKRNRGLVRRGEEQKRAELTRISLPNAERLAKYASLVPATPSALGLSSNQ